MHKSKRNTAQNPANKIKNPLLCDNRLFILLGQRPFYEIISFYYNAIKPQITSQRERLNSDILITITKKEDNIMQLIANYSFKLQQNTNLLNELSKSPYRWLRTATDQRDLVQGLVICTHRASKYQKQLNDGLTKLINETDISKNEIIKILKQIDDFKTKYISFFKYNLEIIQMYNKEYYNSSKLHRLRHFRQYQAIKEQIENSLDELVTGLAPFADYFQELVKVVNLQIKIEKGKSL